ncbi:hypothetical protein QP238_14835, partial [Enterococcus faecalis]|uniref:hypothetical protein n=1 Tax=Enterococcus faecalis TaxID=1351 RepID=UPI0025515F8B
YTHFIRFIRKYFMVWASQVVLIVKNLPASAGDSGDTGSIPELGRSPEKEMATRSSILAWRIPMDRGAWLAIVLGLQRAGHD